MNLVAEQEKDFIKGLGCEYIHNTKPSGAMMFGADHELQSVLDDIDENERIAILTDKSGSFTMGHHLTIIIDNKHSLFDIGNISEEDLIIE